MPFNLSNLGLSVKLLFSGYLIAIGYGVALVRRYVQFAQRSVATTKLATALQTEEVIAWWWPSHLMKRTLRPSPVGKCKLLGEAKAERAV
jgi:hypothetical protein